MRLSGIFVIPAHDQTMSGKLGKRNLSQWNERECHGGCTHVTSALESQVFSIPTCSRVCHGGTLSSAPLETMSTMLTMLTREFKDESNMESCLFSLFENPDDSPIQGQHRLANQVPQKQIIVVWRE